ncbi:hypothetical protein LTR49_028162, partial [Elasticomyces elasticus]
MDAPTGAARICCTCGHSNFAHCLLARAPSASPTLLSENEDATKFRRQRMAKFFGEVSERLEPALKPRTVNEILLGTCSPTPPSSALNQQDPAPGRSTKQAPTSKAISLQALLNLTPPGTPDEVLPFSSFQPPKIHSPKTTETPGMGQWRSKEAEECVVNSNKSIGKRKRGAIGDRHEAYSETMCLEESDAPRKCMRSRDLDEEAHDPQICPVTAVFVGTDLGKRRKIG